MYCKKYFCTLLKLTMYTPTLCCAWLVRYSVLVLFSLAPALGLYKGPRYLHIMKTLESHHGALGQLSHLCGPLCFDIPSGPQWGQEKIFMPLLCCGIQSLKMQYTDISSAVRSPPGDAATRRGMALNDLCYLPGNISLHNPQSFFPPYRAPSVISFSEVNFLFLLF